MYFNKRVIIYRINKKDLEESYCSNAFLGEIGKLLAKSKDNPYTILVMQTLSPYADNLFLNGKCLI